MTTKIVDEHPISAHRSLSSQLGGIRDRRSWMRSPVSRMPQAGRPSPTRRGPRGVRLAGRRRPSRRLPRDRPS